MISMRSGKLAGKNPWNSDGLEWETDSPPKSYATVHIPTVVSRHPLWDDHDEDMILTTNVCWMRRGMTPTTRWLDARPLGMATMPGDTLLPLLSAVTMFVLFFALIFQMLWLALLRFLATLVMVGYWLWPSHKGDRLMGIYGSPPFIPRETSDCASGPSKTVAAYMRCTRSSRPKCPSLFVFSRSYYYLGNNKEDGPLTSRQSSLCA